MMHAQVIAVASVIITITGTNGVVTAGGGLGVAIVALEGMSSASHWTGETRAVNSL